MSVLRTEHEAVLADLHARGEELLLRYQAALGRTDLPTAVSDALERILDARRVLVAELAGLESASGDLPKAGNQERAELETAFDRLSGIDGDAAAVVDRLRQADEDWLEAIRHDLRQDWSSAQVDLLERLVVHLHQSLQWLAQAAHRQA